MNASLLLLCSVMVAATFSETVRGQQTLSPPIRGSHERVGMTNRAPIVGAFGFKLGEKLEERLFNNVDRCLFDFDGPPTLVILDSEKGMWPFTQLCLSVDRKGAIYEIKAFYSPLFAANDKRHPPISLSLDRASVHVELDPSWYPYLLSDEIRTNCARFADALQQQLGKEFAFVSKDTSMHDATRPYWVLSELDTWTFGDATNRVEISHDKMANTVTLTYTCLPLKSDAERPRRVFTGDWPGIHLYASTNQVSMPFWGISVESQ